MRDRSFCNRGSAFSPTIRMRALQRVCWRANTSSTPRPWAGSPRAGSHSSPAGYGSMACAWMRRSWRSCVSRQLNKGLTRARTLLCCGASLLGMSAQHAIGAQDAPLPSAFVAKFAIEWHGITAGYSQLELTRSAPNTYTYRSRNLARGIFRLAFPDAISQVSEFVLVEGEVRPSSYHADDGSRDSGKSVDLKFDWQARRATGSAANKSVDIALASGTQDPLS